MKILYGLRESSSDSDNTLPEQRHMHTGNVFVRLTIQKVDDFLETVIIVVLLAIQVKL